MLLFADVNCKLERKTNFLSLVTKSFITGYTRKNDGTQTKIVIIFFKLIYDSCDYFLENIFVERPNISICLRNYRPEPEPFTISMKTQPKRIIDCVRKICSFFSVGKTF